MTAHRSEGTPLVPLGQGTVQCECPLGVSKEPAHLVFSESKHLEACHDSRQDSISQERTTVTPVKWEFCLSSSSSARYPTVGRKKIGKGGGGKRRSYRWPLPIAVSQSIHILPVVTVPVSSSLLILYFNPVL